MAPDARNRRRSSVAEMALLAIAVLVVLYAAATLIRPIVLAVLVSLLLFPAVRSASKAGIPSALSAGILVVLTVCLVAFLVSLLAGPAEQWIDEAPQNLRELRTRLTSAQNNFGSIKKVADEVENLATVDDSARSAQPVVLKGPGILESLVGGLPGLIAAAGIVIFLTYFLLAFGEKMLRQVTGCGRNWAERRRIVLISRIVQSELGHYLGMVTVINILLGVAVAGLAYLLGIDNFLLWGAMVAIFNFAPYLGALASLAVLIVVGFSNFESTSEALILPLGFLVMTAFEGQLITPTVLGRRMALSPIVVFLAVVVWGWLWGLVGALVAVPLVTCFVVVCDNIPAVAPLAGFLRGQRGHGRPASRTRGKRLTD